MVRGIDNAKKRGNKKGLMEEKDYITEAWLQGGKAVGEIMKSCSKSKDRKYKEKEDK